MAFNEKLRLIIDADGKGAIKGLEDVGRTAERELGKAEGKARNWSATFTRAGAAMVTGAGIAAVGVWKLGQSASDLEQQIGGTQAVFGKSSAAIDAWAKTASRSAGLSEAAARQATTQIGGLLQNFGMGAEAAADEAINLTQVGADLAATFGYSVEEAITAVSAALRGERDPIEKFAVAFKETDVSARIAAMGLDTSTAAAEKNAKIQATLAILYEQTAAAQGQFGREADTLAGKQAIMAAEFENVKAAIGEGVLPVLSTLMGAVADTAGAFNALDPAIKGAMGTALVTATGISGIGGAFLLAAGQAMKFRDTFDQLSPKMQAFSRSAGLIGAALGGAVVGVAALQAAVEAITHANANAAEAYQALGRAAPNELIEEFEKNVTAAEEAQTKSISTSEGWAAALAVVTFGASLAWAAHNRLADSTNHAEKEFARFATDTPTKAQQLADAMFSAGKITEDVYQRWSEKVTENIRGASEEQLAIRKTNDAIAEQQKKIELLTRTREESIEAQYASFDANLAHRRSWMDLNDAVDEYTAAILENLDPAKTSTETAKAAQRAQLGLEAQFLSTATATLKQAEALAAAEGRTLSAAEADNIKREALVQMKSMYPELATLIEGYVAKLDEIPSDVNSTVHLDTAEAERKANSLIGKITNMFGWGSVPSSAIPDGKFGGGPTMAGTPYVVGERGPELFIPTTGGRVISNDRTGNYSASAEAVSVTVNAMTVASADEIVRELSWAMRLSGV